MLPKKTAYCPVCPKNEGQLGYFSPGMPHSFVCRDCQFIYAWDSKGKLLPPVKYVHPRKSKKCTCANCKSRDGVAVDPE